MTTLVYYNGIQYEIENECETEENAKMLPDFEEGKGDTSKMNSISRDFKESAWTPKALQLFLNECIKKKMQIREPNDQIHKTFFAIHEQMKKKGFTFKAISLERKLCSMKKHFFFLCESNRNPDMKRSHWPYYNSLKKLYGKRALQESSKPVVEKDKDKPQTNSNTILNSQSDCPKEEVPIVPSLDACENETRQSKNNVSIENPANMTDLRKRILCLEERRTVAAEKILHELRRSNKLKLEMLDINKKIFEAEKDDEFYY